MSYLVLARKWRPETFSEVVGQKHVVLTLAAAVEADRIAHAYLFAGPRGVGKTTVARILAKALNCSKGPTPNPCGECDPCKEISSGKSLDVIEIDGASNRKIEDARGIREAVQYAPLSGRMKVYIIDEAHMLTREAFNALLKTLEEPPAHVVFVLATTEPGKIPETIASRCQRFDFHRISTPDIEGRLVEIAEAEGIEAEDGALRLVAARADGSMRDAESLLDQLISVGSGRVTTDDVTRVLGIPDVEVFFRISDAIASNDTGATLAALEGALDAGFDPRDLLDGVVEHLRNLLLVVSAPKPERVVGRISDYKSHEGPSASLSEDDLVRLIRIGVEAQSAVKWSTQSGLLLELALLRMAKLARTVDIEEIVRAVGSPGPQGPDGGAAGEPPRRRSGSSSGTPGGGVGSARQDQSSKSAQSPSGGPTAKPGPGVDVLAGGVVSPDRWPEVLERIRVEKPVLAASLAGAIPRAGGKGELGLSVPNGSVFHRDQLQDRANMAIMEGAASEIFGAGVRLSLDFGSRSPERQSPGHVDGGAAPQDRPDVSAGDDPMVKKVLEMFGGEITGIRKEG